MSLIADALDAAQRERAKRSGVRQAALVETPSGFRNVAKRTRLGIPPELAIALAGLAAVAVVVAVVSIMTANSRSSVTPDPSTASAPPIPLPVQIPLTDTMPTIDSAASSTYDPTPVSGGAYERAINEYEQQIPDSRTFATRAPGADAFDEPAPITPSSVKKEEKGSFKITMQASAPAPAPNTFFQQGLAAQQRGDFTAARKLYIQADASRPKDAETLNNLGAAYRSLGDLKLAEETYRRALAADPRFAPAWSNLAVVLDAVGKRQDATAALQEALRLDPRNVSTKVNLAIQFTSLGIYPEARRLLEEALKDNNTLAEAHYTLGQVLERQGDRTQAIAEYRAFLGTSRGRFAKQEIEVRQHLRDLGTNAPNE